jgi:hypothetical protein
VLTLRKTQVLALLGIYLGSPSNKALLSMQSIALHRKQCFAVKKNFFFQQKAKIDLPISKNKTGVRNYYGN